MVNARYCADAHCVANHFAVLAQLKPFLQEESATTAMGRRYPPTARSAHFRQPLRSLHNHVYSPLQFPLQVGNVHLVRDAIRVADTLHVAVLHQFIETPHYRNGRQPQGV